MEEGTRLAELHRLGILDTPPEAEFESLVRAAAAIAGAPTALLTLIDEDRLWFKAAVHMAARETPRDEAFCAAAILQPDEVLVVPDTTADPRFATSPLVQEPPNVRFYAGAPLRTRSGAPIGTLCVLDYEPRELSAIQREALAGLAQQAVRAIEARAHLEELAATLTGRRRAASPEALQAIIDGAPGPIYIKDTAGRYLLTNRASTDFVGVDQQEVLGRTDEELFDPAFAAALSNADRRVIESGEPLETEDVGRSADGRRHVFVARRFALKDSGGQVYAVCALFTDITERKASEQALMRSEAVKSAVLSGAADAIVLLDEDGRIVEANPAAARMLPGELTGRTLAEVIGSPAGVIARRIPPLADPLPDDHIELLVRRPDGPDLPVEASFSRLDVGDRAVWCAFLHDLTGRRRFEDALRSLAECDALTGLANREAFERELDLRSSHGGGTLVLLDLDHFAELNASFGHKTGDEYLASIGAPLAALDGVEVAGRLAADVFGVLAARGAERLPARLLDIVRGHVVEHGRRQLRTTASAGVVHFAAGDSSVEVLAAADRALHAAKASGRDRAVEHSDDMAGSATTVDRIRSALADDRFVLHAQPIVELPGGRVTHYEVLLRMIGERGELIPPDEFISLAERFDLIQAIDRWVVPRGIALAARARAAGVEATFEINLSARSIADPGLLEIIERSLAEHAPDPPRVAFEITETAAIHHLSAVRRFAEALRGLGCSFALDDFGTGFGSFEYLKHLAADFVKIDRDFVRDLPRSRVDQEIVRSVVSVVRVLGGRIIAEGVEEPEAQALLAGYGVELAQGFLYGVPVPADELVP